VQAEELTGENQYEAEGFGKQDAKKFIRFRKLPPVLQV
jgi:ubiquitin carboxyl-terminal hydrolase 7